MKKIKIRSEIEKRSMNSEILFIIERGLDNDNLKRPERKLSHETRSKLWKSLLGKWRDTRKTEDIIKDIYSNRSKGRDFSL